MNSIARVLFFFFFFFFLQVCSLSHWLIGKHRITCYVEKTTHKHYVHISSNIQKKKKSIYIYDRGQFSKHFG